MNNANVQKFIGFINDVCAKYECVDAAKPLTEGLLAFCEAAFQHPTFDDPAQHKAYWKNVFFRLKTIGNVVSDLRDKLFNDLYNAHVRFGELKTSEKRDKSGYVMKCMFEHKIPLEISFTMPYSDNYDILVSGRVGKLHFDANIPETDLNTTEWSFDGSMLNNRFMYNGPAYDTIYQAIMTAVGEA